MLLVSPPKKPTMSDEVFPAELVDELALVRDALHFAVSWLGWRKWLRASGLLEWCSTGVLVPSGCGTFAPFWQYESDWATYLSRLRLDRRRVAGDSPFSPYTVLGGEEEFSREDEERIARLVMRRRSLERLEREWCRNNSHALRRVRPALLVFSSANGSHLPQPPLLYSEYARISLDETRWYAEQSDLVDFVGRLVRTLVERFGRIGKEEVRAADPVVDAFLDKVASSAMWRHKLDETLNSFDDETLDLLLRAFASCRTHIVKEVAVYSRERTARCAQSDTRLVDAESPQESLHLGNWPVLSFLLVDIRFVRVSRVTIWRDTLHLFMGRFQHSLDSLMRASGDWLTTIPVPDTERDAIYVVRSDDEKSLATSLSRVVVPRSDLRSLLNYTFLPNERTVLYGGPLATETAALSAVFSASETRATVQRVTSGKSENEPDNADQVCCDLREVLLRALQLRSVAVYFLRYSSVSQPPAVATDDKLRVFLERSGLGRERYFIDNGIERGTALTDAVLSFAAQVGLDRDVNLLRLQDVRAYASYDQVRVGDENREKGHSSFDTLLVATSALLSTDGVEHFTRAASQQLRDNWPRSARYGMFFRHERYSDLQLLLLPAECSPVFDRVIELPGENRPTEQSCNGYLRLCLFKLRDQDEDFSERALTNPAVIASLLREVVAHITVSNGVNTSAASYSPLLSFAQRNDDTSVQSAQPMIHPSLQNLFDRDKIASMVRIDPFLAIAPCGASADAVSSQRSAALVESLPRYFFPNCKLWRALDTLPTKCAFVRTTPVTYCPHLLFECGLSQTQRGLVPLEATNSNDTWKLYIMDNVRSKKLTPCDRCYAGPPSEDPPIFYREAGGEKSEITPTTPMSDGPDVKKETKESVRHVDGQVTISSVVPYFAVKNAHGRDWLLYETGGIGKFDSIVTALRLERVLTASPVVRLINWDEHFSPDDPNKPRLEKLSAKRVYMINGLIGFCEQQTKFVSGSKLPRPSHPVSVVNFANALIRPGDSLCFHNTVDRVDPTIRIAPMHFYHRVYQNMVRNERHPIVGDGGYVDLRFRETADYFVLVFQCTRIWFPRVELLQRLVETETTCFGETPRHLVPLVDFYARQALRKK